MCVTNHTSYLESSCHKMCKVSLTPLRLQHLTLPVLIDRLVLRRDYCLAIRICQYLKLPDAEGASRVLAHWACYKVHVSEEHPRTTRGV